MNKWIGYIGAVLLAFLVYDFIFAILYGYFLLSYRLLVGGFAPDWLSLTITVLYYLGIALSALLGAYSYRYKNRLYKIFMPRKQTVLLAVGLGTALTLVFHALSDTRFIDPGTGVLSPVLTFLGGLLMWMAVSYPFSALVMHKNRSVGIWICIILLNPLTGSVAVSTGTANDKIMNEPCGLEVLEYEPGSPLAEAGIEPGSRMVTIENQTITDLHSLVQAETVTVTLSNGTEYKIQPELRNGTYNYDFTARLVQCDRSYQVFD